MGNSLRFEGTLWRDGDGSPAVVVGEIEKGKGSEPWRGAVALKGPHVNRALATPGDWNLSPEAGLVIRVRLAPVGGDHFSFEGHRV